MNRLVDEECTGRGELGTTEGKGADEGMAGRETGNALPANSPAAGAPGCTCLPWNCTSAEHACSSSLAAAQAAPAVAAADAAAWSIGIGAEHPADCDCTCVNASTTPPSALDEGVSDDVPPKASDV